MEQISPHRIRIKYMFRCTDKIIACKHLLFRFLFNKKKKEIIELSF